MILVAKLTFSSFCNKVMSKAHLISQLVKKHCVKSPPLYECRRPKQRGGFRAGNRAKRPRSSHAVNSAKRIKIYLICYLYNNLKTNVIRNADAISRDAEQCGFLRIKKRIKIPLEFADCSTFERLKSALPKAAHPHF